ncbi:Heterokaryon incompatibility protein (HET) domain containing protein [Naviculisporaceae sp. PSN 640]
MRSSKVPGPIILPLPRSTISSAASLRHLPSTSMGRYAELKTSTVLAELGQALVRLSRQNTQELLGSASERQRGRRQDAAAILARLGELNPTVAKQFQPKLDAIDSLSLRMVVPSDALPKDANTARVPSYIIVSYCWHYPEWPLAPTAKPIVPGWEISKPMVDAFMGLRQSPDEGVWLDKLCINQEDESDKREHIAAMDIIYKSARRLIILLEDVQLSREQTVAGLTYATFFQDLRDEINKRGLEGRDRSDLIEEYFPGRERELRAAGSIHLIDAIKDFVLTILNGRWYTRAWCAHESRVKPHEKINNPLFLCFDHEGRVISFEFAFVFYLTTYLNKTRRDPSEEMQPTGWLATVESMDNPKTLGQCQWRIQKLDGRHEPEGSAMQHLIHVLSSGCLKKGDLMSIALNTSGIPLAFVGELSAVEDVMWIFSLLVLATDDLVPLITIDGAGGCRTRITDPHDPNNKLVSWIPTLYHGMVEDKVALPSRETITAVAGHYIELDLLLFKALPCAPSAESQEIASRLLEEHNLHAIALESIEEADDYTKRKHKVISATMEKVSRDRPGPMGQFHKLWLAYALDCGLDWLLRLPDVMRDGTNNTAWTCNHDVMDISPNPKFTTTAESLLRHFFPDPKDYEVRAKEYLPQIIRSVTTLFDPRLPFFTTSPRRLPLGNGDHAFVACSSNIAYIAVPVCLAHLPASYLRAWTLEPFDPQGPPENLPDDHLPDLTKIYPRDARAVDVFPVNTSDFEDRRQPRDDNRGTWRLRLREKIFGFTNWSLPVSEEDFPPDGEVVYLKRQKVYGAEGYDWGAMREASTKLRFEPEPEVESGPGTGTETEGEDAPEQKVESTDAEDAREQSVADVLAS